MQACVHALRMAKRVQQPNGQIEWVDDCVPPRKWGGGPDPEIQVAVEDDGMMAWANLYAAAAQEEGGLASRLGVLSSRAL